MKIIPSGVDRRQFAEVLNRLGVTGMINTLDMTPSLIAACREIGFKSKVADSGAFQGNEDIEKYACTVSAYEDDFEWWANLDKIGDQRQSNANYARLSQLLPARAHEKVLWIYQYSPETMCDLDAYVREYGPFIGIGGLVPYIKKDLSRACAIVDAICEVLRRHNAWGHFFGFNNYPMVVRYANVKEVYSCDASLWLIGASKNLLLDNRGERHDVTRLFLTVEQKLENNVRAIQSWPQTNIMPRLKRNKVVPTLFDALLPQEEVQDANIA